MQKQESNLSKSTFDTTRNDSDCLSDKSPKSSNINKNCNNNYYTNSTTNNNSNQTKNKSENNYDNKKPENKFKIQTEPNSKQSQKPFFYKKFTQAETWPEYLKASIAIALLTLPYYGFGIFLTLFYFSGFYTRVALILLALLQNLIPTTKNKYFNFIKLLEPIKYFKSFTLIVEEELAEKGCIFPASPHGIMCLQTALHILHGLPILRKFHACGSRFMIFIPFTGVFGRLIGVESVDNHNFKALLQQRQNIMFIPGGWECATLSDPTMDRVFIKDRKGFIKYALMFGVKVHPVYNFGENKFFSTFKKWKFLDTLEFMLNKIKFPGVLFWGRFLFFPYADVDCCSVVGKGIQLPKIPNPTKMQIDKYHKIYVDRFVELFDRYKKQYGAADKLEIN